MTTPIGRGDHAARQDRAASTGQPCTVASCAGGQRTDAGEGDLAQPEHAALTGDQRVAREDHGEARRRWPSAPSQ